MPDHFTKKYHPATVTDIDNSKYWKYTENWDIYTNQQLQSNAKPKFITDKNCYNCKMLVTVSMFDFYAA
jgi:hypothetical protein